MGYTPSPGCQLGPTPQSISQCHSVRHIKTGLALNSLHLFFKELIHKPKYLIISSKWLHILQLTQAHKCANNSSRPRKRKDGFQAEGTNTEVCKARGVFQESKKVVWLQLPVQGMVRGEIRLERQIQTKLQRASKLLFTGCVTSPDWMGLSFPILNMQTILPLSPGCEYYIRDVREGSGAELHTAKERW